MSEINVEQETARLFPYGKIGDIRYHTGLNELVLIDECTVAPHKHKKGKEHSHTYWPSIVSTPWRKRLEISNPDRLVSMEEAELYFRKEYKKQNGGKS